MQIRSQIRMMKNFDFFKKSPLYLCHPATDNVSLFSINSYSSPSEIQSSTKQQDQLADEEIKKRIQQTSEYFSQYIEEYYEEEEEPEPEEIKVIDEKPIEPIIKNDISDITQDEIVALLQEHRAQNILSIEVRQEKSPWKYVIICSPYNDRHGYALMQTIRKHIKTLYNFEVCFLINLFVNIFKT